MLLKLLACGPLGYIQNPYNIFDGIIVVMEWNSSLSLPCPPTAPRIADPHHWERPCRPGAEVQSPGAGPLPPQRQSRVHMVKSAAAQVGSF